MFGLTREQMLLRAGFYMGLAQRYLNDSSFADRWMGRAGEMTEADYMQETAEIQSRLVAGGFIAPDEDPYRTIYVYENP